MTYALAFQNGWLTAPEVMLWRAGGDLMVGRYAEHGRHPKLTIEGFFGSGGRLIAADEGGNYQECFLGDDSGEITVDGLKDGMSSRLSLGLVDAASNARAADYLFDDLSGFNGARTMLEDRYPEDDRGAGVVADLATRAARHWGAPVAGIGQMSDAGGSTRSGSTNDDMRSTRRAAGAHDRDSLFDRSAPVIDAVLDGYGAIQGVIADGGYTDDTRAQIIGSAEAGTVVTVYRGTYMIGSATADADGKWAYPPTTPLGDGVHSISVVYKYPDGAISDGSDPYVITVDTVSPQPPVVTGMVDDEGRITGAISHQMVTDDSRPTINGTAEPFAVVVIYDKGKEIERTEAGVDGAWAFTPSLPLADGLHLLSFAAIDRAGNDSEQSITVEFVVDTRPEQVSIYFAEDDVGGVTGPVFSGSTTDDSMPTLRGAATAGGIVKIYEGSVLLGQTTAGFDGSWSFTSATRLGEGEHSFHATVTREATGESAPSDVFRLKVDVTPPVRPSIDSARDNQGEIQGMLSSGEATDDDTPTLIGTAVAGATVAIHLDGSVIATVVAAADGRWSFTPEEPLLDGTYGFTATAVDLAGNVSAPSDQFDITIDSSPPARPTILNVIDSVGATTGGVANGGTTDDTRPEINGMAEAGCVIVVRDGGVEIGRTLANSAGQWTFVPSTGLTDGSHDLTVEAVDAAGNISEPSSQFEVIVDTYLPIATVTQIGRDSGFDDGDFLTNDGTAGRVIKGILSGPLRGDQRLEISTDDGVMWSSVVMREDGGWMHVDYSSHSGSWEILTRVASDTGSTGEAESQRVLLDVVAPAAPAAISSNGSTVTVFFDAATAVEGGRIYLNDGEHYLVHRLTASDVAAGKVMITPEFEISRATKAAIVDQAGNMSKFRYNSMGTVSEDFSSTIDSTRYTQGQTLVLDTMSVKVLQGTTFVGTYNDTPGYGTGKRLYFGYSGNDKLEISFEPASKVSFTTDYLHNSATYAFYDIYGNLLQTQSFPGAPGGYRVTYTAEQGALIGSVMAHTTEWGFLDNFEFAVYGTTGLEEDALTKYVSDEHLIYLGDGRDETFVVDASRGNIEAGIHGGGGTDTLRLLGSGQILDLASWGGGIKSIEVIDMNKGSNNVLKLSLAEVLENGAKGLFLSDDRVQMKVMGKRGDTVELDDALDGVALGWWREQGQVRLAGIVYNLYQHSGAMAEVLVKADVSVQIGLGTGVTIESVGRQDEGQRFEVTDGAAGQLVRGRLGGELAPGMDLQVSVDDGLTWQSALVNGRSWAFLDTSIHDGDWRVLTRISNGVNHLASLVSQSVSLLAPLGAPVITSIPDAAGIYGSTQAKDGSVMTVALFGTGAAVGDKVHIQWGSSTYDQVLMQVNINNGFITLNVPAAVTQTAQGYSHDFSVTAQIVGKNGALGTLSAPIDVVSTYTRAMVSDSLQRTPAGDEYAGNGFTITTTGNMVNTSATTSSLAGLTFSDTDQANATFTLNRPVDHISLRLSGAGNDLGAHIRIFDTNGDLMHEETVFGDATVRHLKVFNWTKTGIADIGSFTVTAMSESITLDGFTHYVVNHVRDTRDPNLIDNLSETFYGTSANDVVSLSQSAQVYFSQAAAMHGGGGVDTLKLLGGNHQLDLTAAGNKISSMEVLDIGGAGNNVLTLNLSDVLRNGGVDAFHAGDESRVQMMVKGNAGDKVSLSDLLAGGVDYGDWIKVAASSIGGAIYETYQHSALGVELLVQQGVTVAVTNSTPAGGGSDYGSGLDVAAVPGHGVERFPVDSWVLESFAEPATGNEGYLIPGCSSDAMHLQELRLEVF